MTTECTGTIKYSLNTAWLRRADPEMYTDAATSSSLQVVYQFRHQCDNLLTVVNSSASDLGQRLLTSGTSGQRREIFIYITNYPLKCKRPLQGCTHSIFYDKRIISWLLGSRSLHEMNDLLGGSTHLKTYPVLN
jgi:hypothetical protein